MNKVSIRVTDICVIIITVFIVLAFFYGWG
jgi:hypothetical protein